MKSHFLALTCVAASLSAASAATMDVQLINFGAAGGGTYAFSTSAGTSLSAAAFTSATITRDTATLPTLAFTVAGLDLTEVGGPSSVTINFQLDFSVNEGTAQLTTGGAFAIVGSGTNRINGTEIGTITTSQTSSTEFVTLGGIRQMNVTNWDAGDVADITFLANNGTPTTITNDFDLGDGAFQYLNGADQGTSSVSLQNTAGDGTSDGVYWNRVDLRFDVPIVVPEPSVGLLGAFSGLALLLRRRR